MVFLDWFLCPSSICKPTLLDPATWPFIKNPVYPISSVLAYFAISTLVGPWVMMNRCPRSVTVPLAMYNFILAIANLAVGCGLTYFMIKRNYSIWCESVPSKKCQWDTCAPFGDERDLIQFLIGVYHVIRLVQLIECLFYIVRQQRVTLTKVIHHSSMVLLTWAACKYALGGTTALLVTNCCFTFVAIYLYLVVFGKCNGFNTFASIVQIIHFLLAGLSSVATYKLNCGYPEWASLAILIFVVAFSILVLSDLSWTSDGKFSPSISTSATGFGRPWFIHRKPKDPNSNDE